MRRAPNERPHRLLAAITTILSLAPPSNPGSGPGRHARPAPRSSRTRIRRHRGDRVRTPPRSLGELCRSLDCRARAGTHGAAPKRGEAHELKTLKGFRPGGWRRSPASKAPDSNPPGRTQARPDRCPRSKSLDTRTRRPSPDCPTAFAHPWMQEDLQPIDPPAKVSPAPTGSTWSHRHRQLTHVPFQILRPVEPDPN